MTLKALLFGLFLLSIAVWIALNGRAGRYDFRTRFDRMVPFVPSFTILYIGTYPLIGAACFFLFFSDYAVPYFLALSVAMYTAALSWYFFPAKSFRPQIRIGERVVKTLVIRFYDGNSHGNAFPSAHVITSSVTAYFLSLLYPPASFAFFTVAFLIALSTLFIKQHHVFDVPAGILWSVAAILVARILVPF
jgi:membrane-associated phospholipid phosphatase